MVRTSPVRSPIECTWQSLSLHVLYCISNEQNMNFFFLTADVFVVYITQRSGPLTLTPYHTERRKNMQLKTKSIQYLILIKNVCAL